MEQTNLVIPLTLTCLVKYYLRPISLGTNTCESVAKFRRVSLSKYVKSVLLLFPARQPCAGVERLGVEQEEPTKIVFHPMNGHETN